MEPGWQRNVVLGVALALWVVGSGFLEVDAGGQFMDGILNGLVLVALLGVLTISRMVGSPGIRFAVMVLAVGVVEAVYQLLANGSIGWTWLTIVAFGIATVMTVVDHLVRLWDARRRARPG